MPKNHNGCWPVKEAGPARKPGALSDYIFDLVAVNTSVMGILLLLHAADAEAMPILLFGLGLSSALGFCHIHFLIISLGVGSVGCCHARVWMMLAP